MIEWESTYLNQSQLKLVHKFPQQASEMTLKGQNTANIDTKKVF